LKLINHDTITINSKRMLEGRKWRKDGWRCSEQKREERKI